MEKKKIHGVHLRPRRRRGTAVNNGLTTRGNTAPSHACCDLRPRKEDIKQWLIVDISHHIKTTASLRRDGAQLRHQAFVR